MSSLRKRVKKEASFLGKFFLLVGFKEAYFFAKNLLGMIIHPQLTTAKILSRRDFSQAFLVFGLPLNLWMILLVSSFLIWFFLRPSGFLFTLGAAFFILVGLFLLGLTFYYFFWVAKYLKRSKKSYL